MKYFLLFLALIPLSVAQLELDAIRFEPGIINGGDTVDILVQFSDPAQSERAGNEQSTLTITLEPDDALSEEYVTILDPVGDDVRGSIIAGGVYAKRFRVKVATDAPAADYEFRLNAQWTVNGIPQSANQFLRFRMPVKRTGVLLKVGNVLTQPTKVHSGDDGIVLSASLFNTGEKELRDAVITFAYPLGIRAAASGNNEQTVVGIPAGGSIPLTLALDIANDLPAGTYAIPYRIQATDRDSNSYEVQGSLPFVIHARPRIIVTNASVQGRAGDTVQLLVTVQNVGGQRSDAVDVRLVRQSSQPFSMDVRTDYVGPLAPGENGSASFKVAIDRNADLREHALVLSLRAIGAREEGDDAVYVSTDRATIAVTDAPRNIWPIVALVAALILGVSAFVLRKKR